MKKGVDYRPATGVAILACTDLLLVIDLVTGGVITNDIMDYALLIICPLSLFIGFKLYKNYDEDDNYDNYFRIVLTVLLPLFIFLAYYRAR